MTPLSPEKQLTASLAKLTPEIRAEARGARANLQKLLPVSAKQRARRHA